MTIGACTALMAEIGIVHQTRTEKHDMNVLAIVDRVIQNLKNRMAETMAAEGGAWEDRLKQITDSYNATDHSAMHGEPRNVATNEVQRFLTYQDNAENAAHNTKVSDRRTKALEKTMALLPTTQWWDEGF